MPNQIIPNAARQMLEVLATRRSQREMHMHDIECELEEIDAELDRLTTLISAYDEIGRRTHSPVELRHKPLEYNSPSNPTTENVTLIERVKQMVLMYPGKASEIAGRLGKSARSISSRLTVLANMGEIAHWPECHMWGPLEWTPPTKRGTSNA